MNCKAYRSLLSSWVQSPGFSLRGSLKAGLQTERLLGCTHTQAGIGVQSTSFSLPGSLRAGLQKVLGPLCLVLLSIGCAVGPNYKRPPYPIPLSHRSETALPAAAPTPATLGDVKWFELFRDEKLQELIRIALMENYDVRIAAQRVLAAQAFVTVEKSALYPSVDAVGSADRQQGVNRAVSSVFGWWQGHLGAGYLGPHPPLDRGRSGRVPGSGGRSAGRDSEPGDRSGK